MIDANARRMPAFDVGDATLVKSMRRRVVEESGSDGYQGPAGAGEVRPYKEEHGKHEVTAQARNRGDLPSCIFTP